MNKFRYSPLALLVVLPFSSVAEMPDSWAERNPISFWRDRALEDWSYVDNMDEHDKTLAERLKRIPLSEDEKWKASFSHNLRVSFDNKWNENYKDDISGRIKNAVITRYYFGSEVNYDDFFRVYGELRVNYASYQEGNAGPVDDAGTDIHQLFAEVNLLEGEGEKLSAKLGRQEVFISNLQMGNREPTGVQGSWDSISANYMKNGKRIYAFYGEEIFPPTTITPQGHVTWAGDFDDIRTGNTSGGINVQIPSSFGYLSLYALDTHIKMYDQPYRRFVFANQGAADVYSLGAALTKRTRNGLGYHAEGIYQFGDNEGKDISAYMGFADINYTWAGDWSWKTGVKLHHASGTEAGSDDFNTFNPLWTDDILSAVNSGAYSNVNQLGWYLETGYSPGQNVAVGFLSTWRVSTDDAIYTKDQSMLFGADSEEKYAYTQAYVRLTNMLTPTLKLDTGLTYAFDSSYIKDVVGEQASSDSKRIEMVLTYNF